MRVFISHSNLDREVTKTLVDLLQRALNLRSEVIRCTSLDGYRLPAGVLTIEALRQEVYEATLVIGLITPNSLRSAYVLFELGARWGAKKAMMPLLAMGTKPEHLEGPLKEINVLDCSNESQVLQLVVEAAGHLEIEPDSVPSYINTVKKLVETSSRDLYSEPPEHNDQTVQSSSAEPQIPPLSKEAESLLIGASNDTRRSIMKTKTQDGTRITIGNREFTDGSPRSEALWEAALAQLVEYGLVEDTGKGAVFRVSHQGYNVADLLKVV